MQHATRLTALPLALMLGACGGGLDSTTPGDSETVAETEQPSTAFDFGTWPRRPMPLDFCTRSDGSLSDETFLTVRAWAVDALQATWNQVPGVNIVDRGICVEGTLPLTLWLEATDVADIGAIHGHCGPKTNCTVWTVEGDFSPEAENRVRSTV